MILDSFSSEITLLLNTVRPIHNLVQFTNSIETHGLRHVRSDKNEDRGEVGSRRICKVEYFPNTERRESRRYVTTT